MSRFSGTRTRKAVAGGTPSAKRRSLTSARMRAPSDSTVEVIWAVAVAVMGIRWEVGGHRYPPPSLPQPRGPVAAWRVDALVPKIGRAALHGRSAPGGGPALELESDLDAEHP